MSSSVCRSCGRAVAPDFRLCPYCGAELTAPASAREERKIVTVLFCDLVGFTQRSEAMDPEDVRALLRGYHEHLRGELERFGGTVEKFIGDAVVAVFGAPQAHEDDPERAVRAALAIREWANEQEGLELRIAVNTGEALVTLDAQPGEGMVAGDVVNTAARLQAAAPTNGILAGETTYRATRQVIDYREAEPVAAKGKTEPVPVWEALEARARFGVDVRQHGAARLVGRAAELDALVGALQRARTLRNPQFVSLVGAPGIGKSRLVWELFKVADADPELIRWRQGRSLPYGAGASFWALAEMVKAETGILETDTAEKAAEKLHDIVRETVRADDAAWVEEHLRPLVGLGGRSDASDTRDEAFAAWRLFLEALAEEGPAVLVFEDLHWADEALLDFVDHLLEWASGVPLLIVCSARPELLERRPGWGGGKLNATTLGVGPLADDDAARLIGDLVDRALLPAETQAALLDRAGGNPLYAEQYALLFRERGSVERMPLPETVHGIIAARLDGLAPTEKRALQDAAVVGKVFWPGAVAALDGSAPDTLPRSLHALARKDFVRRERRSSIEREEEYAFHHVLVRDVAYGQIPRADRVEKHRRAAAWIEALGRPEDHADALAHHYLTAFELARAAGRRTDGLEEPARRALREAGARALALNSFAAAKSFYSSALELWPPDDPDFALVLFAYGRAVFNVEEAGEDVLSDAVDRLVEIGRVEEAAEAVVLLVELAWKRGDQAETFERLQRATALVEDRSASRAKADVLSAISRFRMLAGDGDEAVRVGREALAMAERLGLDDIRAHTLISIGPARHFGGDPGGLADIEEGIRIAAAINSPQGVRGYTNLAAMVAVDGDVRRAAELEEEGLALARRFGHEPSGRFLEANRALSAYQLGDWESAIAGAAAFEGSHHYQEAGLIGTRSLIRLARGDVGGAQADAERGLDLARGAKDPQTLGPALGIAAYVLFVLGRRAVAEKVAGELLDDPALASQALWVETSWLVRSIGREAGLDALASSRPSLWLDASRSALEGDFARAADICDEIGALPGMAFCDVRAAEQLMADGRRAEADRHLQRALAFWRSVGASRYVGEAEQLLAATA